MGVASTISMLPSLVIAHLVVAGIIPMSFISSSSEGYSQIDDVDQPTISRTTVELCISAVIGICLLACAVFYSRSCTDQAVL